MMSSIFALAATVFLGMGGSVTGVSISPAAERTQIVISVDGEVDFRDFTLEGPDRLVVDLFGARHALPRTNFMDIDRGGVVSVRTSQYSADVVRVVLVLEGTTDYEIVRGEGGLVIELENPAGGSFAPWSTDPLAPAEPGLRSDDAPSAPAPSGSARPQRTAAEQVQQTQARRMSVDFVNAPISEVLLFFAEFSGHSIVAGSEVTANITATIDDQPWDVALREILAANQFYAEEAPSGIIRVNTLDALEQLEESGRLETRAYKINYATAQEVAQALQGITTQRGSIQSGQGTNTVVVTDINRVQQEVERLISQIDVRTPQVNIQAKIIFVNRTDLNEFGVTYELKDSQGNQLNVVSPGAVDEDGDGVIELPDEEVETGTNVVALGGNSIAALGNASNRVPSPTLTLLTSLLVGRHTLVNFIEALESTNLSDIQAEPSVSVADNQTARIQVGEQTPLRVVDAGTGVAGGQGAALPTASVEIQETGIILEATPHVTDDNILLDLRAERSAPQLAESDVGFIFQTQNANTRVLVRDGQTVVIAGLTVTEKSTVRSGIPLLMDLPLLGRLFRVTRDSNIQRDLIILVTPHIVRPS